MTYQGFDKHLTPLVSLLTLSILAHASPSLASSKPHYKARYYVQLAALNSRGLAEKRLAQYEKTYHLKGRVNKAYVRGHLFYTVQMGPFTSIDKAQQTKHAFHDALMQQSLIKRDNLPPTSPSSHPPAPKPVQDWGPSSAYDSRYQILPYHLRAIGEGTAAERVSFGSAEVMLPVVGNQNWIGFVDGSGRYADNEAWFAGMGLGARGVRRNAIFGAYVFVDHNESIHHRTFNVANPGLEFMTPHWDGHLNGYFPLNGKSRSLGIYPGLDIGARQTLRFQNHTLYEYLYNVADSIGSGVDGEVGYKLSNLYNVRAFVGGYHFNIAHGPSINGVQAGFEIPLNKRLTLIVRDAYDQVQHNTLMGTLRVTFGQQAPVHIDEFNIRQRMLDPIRRNLGAYQTGTGVPVVKTQQRLNEAQSLITNNIWFFSENGQAFDAANGFGNCTIDNPCGTFSQAAIDGVDALSPNARLFVNTGTYDNPAQGTGLALNAGQSVIGRTNNFRRAASADNRPLINDSLTLTSNNFIANLRVNGQTVDNGVLSGLVIAPGASSNIVINNTQAQAIASNATWDAVALNSQNHQAQVTVNDSDFIANMTNSTAQSAIGVQINNIPTMTFNNSAVTANALNSSGAIGFDIAQAPVAMDGALVDVTTNQGKGQALKMNNNANVAVANSTLTLTANDGATSGSIIGMLLQNNSQLELINSVVNLNSTNYSASNIETLDLRSNSNFSMNNSSVNLKLDNAQVSGGTAALSFDTNSSVNIDNSSINYQANDVQAETYYAITVSQNTTTNINNSTIRFKVTNGGNFIVGVNNAGTLNLQQSTIEAFSNNAGQGNGAYGLNSNGTVNIEQTKISLSSENNTNNAIVRAVGNPGGNLSSANAVFLAAGQTPAPIEALSNGGTYTNNGNTTCITIINGVPSVASCQG
ncbi:MAG: hypothetical protein CMF38_02725 [Legionellaceae bacterium]|nr:hypothetical protein [Legionellaceae bacterium]HCA90103.1 hypothetical protein [Legionellales bacterium]|tara:strand:+ start:178 stop:2940 length:2763 start_codon:yes stop_codon:yes gene_type:complete